MLQSSTPLAPPPSTSSASDAARHFFDADLHATFGQTATLLRQRCRAQQLVVRAWHAEGLARATGTAMQITDAGVCVDVVNMLNRRSALYTLDVCAAVLARLPQLLAQCKHDEHVDTVRRALLAIKAGAAGKLIRDRQTPTSCIGVDLASEERRDQTRKCYDALCQIRLRAQQMLQADAGAISHQRSDALHEIVMLVNVFR